MRPVLLLLLLVAPGLAQSPARFLPDDISLFVEAEASALIEGIEEHALFGLLDQLGALDEMKATKAQGPSGGLRPLCALRSREGGRGIAFREADDAVSRRGRRGG